MGCPGGHENDPIYSLSIYARFAGQFFFKSSLKKGCNNDRLFPEKYTLKFYVRYLPREFV